jgi:hypothetical protein
MRCLHQGSMVYSRVHEMPPPGLDGILKSSKITGKPSQVTSLFQTTFMKTCLSPSHSSELEVMIREVAHRFSKTTPCPSAGQLLDNILSWTRDMRDCV